MRPRIAIPVPTSWDFEYNRQSWPEYADAIRGSGGEPVEIMLTGNDGGLLNAITSCDGVLLPGSPSDVDPARYGQQALPACAPADSARERVDIFLLEDAAARGKPVFGICFGAQILNVWRGGTLVQDLTVLPVNHAAGRSVAVAHNAKIAAVSTLGSMLLADSGVSEPSDTRGEFLDLPINSSHHQAIGIPGQGLKIVARCPQDFVVEAIESEEGESWMLGVQWHPERSARSSSTSRLLFDRFVTEAATEGKLKQS